MRSQLERGYFYLVTAAAIWSALNCLYVYFIAADGGATYRIESAVLIFSVLSLPLVWWGGGAQRERAHRSAAPWDVAALVALIAVWLSILGPLRTFPFLSDDYGFLASLHSFAGAARPFQFYRPVFELVFVLLAKVGAASPTVFHLVAFFLHIASTVFVYLLARRIASGPAVVVAAVFLFNPVQLEAVLWVSGLQEVLWTFFVLAALVVYVGQRELSSARVAAVAALVAAAIWSKETAVCIVLLLPIVDAAMFGFRRGRTIPVVYATVVAELAGYLLLRSRAAGFEGAFLVAPSRYFVKQMVVTPYEVFVHPWNRAAVDVPSAVVCGSALLFVALMWIALRRGAPRRVLVGPAFIAASVLPVYSLFFVGPDLAGSRYLYFGAAGFGLFASELLAWLERPRLQALAAGTLALVLCVSLVINVRPWRSAGDLIQTIERAVASEEDTEPVIRSWAQRHRPGLVMKDGAVPDSYQGVWVLRNGYAEFVRAARAR